MDLGKNISKILEPLYKIPYSSPSHNYSYYLLKIGRNEFTIKYSSTSLLIALTKLKRFYRIFFGERYSFKIKYRFQVFVPKRQILPCAVMRTIRSALTCLSVPFITFPIQ